jgi:hypothetical protein
MTRQEGNAVGNQPRHRLGQIEQVCDTSQFGPATAPAIESDSRADSKRFNKGVTDQNPSKSSESFNPVVSENSIALKTRGPMVPSQRDVIPTLRGNF